MAGFICLHRQIYNSSIWNVDTPFDERSAWVDLLLLTNYKDNNITGVKRGQIKTSVRFLAQRWQWGKDRVTNFLNALERENMITKESAKSGTLINIVNYNIYQQNNDNPQTPTGHQQGHQQGQYKDTNKDKYKKEKKEKKEKNNNNPSDCSSELSQAQSQQAPLSPEQVFITLPLNDGEEYQVSWAQVKEYAELFPAVDIEYHIRLMRKWFEDNPKNKKTSRGIRRFMTTWLSREQDKGHRKGGRNEQAQDLNALIAKYDGVG